MIKAFLVGVIRLYQVFFSAVLGNRCRFYPSCSQYTIEAIERYGPVKGSTLGLKRLSRCHPFCEGGVDLVPDGVIESTPENYDLKHKA
jgi:putative membrane protein insertion efficiency factor